MKFRSCPSVELPHWQRKQDLRVDRFGAKLPLPVDPRDYSCNWCWICTCAVQSRKSVGQSVVCNFFFLEMSADRTVWLPGWEVFFCGLPCPGICGHDIAFWSASVGSTNHKWREGFVRCYAFWSSLLFTHPAPKISLYSIFAFSSEFSKIHFNLLHLRRWRLSLGNV